MCDLTSTPLKITDDEHLPMYGTLSHCPPMDALRIANTRPFGLD